MYLEVLDGIEPWLAIPYSVPEAKWCPNAVVAVDPNAGRPMSCTANDELPTGGPGKGTSGPDTP